MGKMVIRLEEVYYKYMITELCVRYRRPRKCSRATAMFTRAFVTLSAYYLLMKTRSVQQNFLYVFIPSAVAITCMLIYSVM